MYLKSIEVQGFKSFAYKTKFNFPKGITAIVGPNGCGKSNVADAVRWVLGEQSAHQLRGDSMQDVIFSGTENRKPLSFASVSITLDNEDHKLPVDFDEVTVTRRLYRSGESEYLLNGASVRLRDVNELFYDTGIGKEGYSIIGQGQIDAILSGKPEERRELFDEAAGIVKFKRRKNVSLKRLESEQQNLLRVNDLLDELTSQLGPLKEQAELAKAYLQKKDELKRYDINMFLLEIARLKEQSQGISDKLDVAHTQLEEAKAQYASMKEEYETVENQVDNIDASIEKANAQLNETTLLKQQLESQIDLLKEQIHSAHMNDEHYSQRSQAIEEDIRIREEQLKQFKDDRDIQAKDLEDNQKLESTAREELVEVQSQAASLSADLEKNQNDHMALLNSRSSTRANIQKYDTMLEQNEARKSEVEEQFKQAEKAKSEQDALAEKYTAQLKEASDKVRELTEENNQLDGRIKELQDQLAKQNDVFRKSQAAYQREQSRLESLQNLTERYDGYGNSIRKVMDRKEKEPGLLGVVADLIQVDQAYETAIETALGGSIQNIVTKDTDTARRMISYLKKGKYGRATFLPLDAIRASGKFQNPEALKEKGVIGTADTLVKTEKEYQILASHLLGRTLVVDTLDHGIAIAKKYNQSIRMVTLEGELLNPGGSMTGGAFKNAGNLLGRRREIEELEKSVQQLKQEMDDEEAKAGSLREERSRYYEELDQKKAALQDAFVVQNTAKMNCDQADAGAKDAGKRCEDLKREAEALTQQAQDIADNQESIQVELETSEKMEKELASQAAKIQKQLDKEKDLESKKQDKAQEIHLTVAGLEQKRDFAESNISRIQDELEKFRSELADLTKSKGGATKDIEEKEAQIKDLQNTIDNSQDLFTEIQQEIEKYRKQREDLNQKNKDFLQKREELSAQVSDLDKEVFRLDSQKSSNEEAYDKQINYLWDEYELTPSQAEEMRDENLTELTKMRRRSSELKGEIRDLGDVNVNAIEEYKNLSERQEFMQNQHDDLVEAAESLQKIIADLDTAMRKQFKEQFARIQKEFDKVFKQLFGGGKATLELVDDEDILESDIRIIAQPPGKKLQNIIMLSGGEKALTAIALLFAVQNLKPSPFCFLDEIEAALDDNNVDRFAKYLHKLTKDTQFIVITHRRGTMNAADQLYGITMQEKGVSSLVSVSLIEDKLDK